MTKTNDEWEPCPPGTLSRVRLQRSSRGIGSPPFRTGLVAGLIACLLFAGFAAIKGGSGGVVKAQLTCAEVFAHRNAYGDGELDSETQALVEAHLVYCEKCRNAYEQLAAWRQPEFNAIAVRTP